MQTVICMRWGTAYGLEFVNKLFSMVRRNTMRGLRFVCFTDDPEGLHPEIRPLPLPPIELPASHRWKPWRKIALWQKRLEDLVGDVLFLDAQPRNGLGAQTSLERIERLVQRARDRLPDEVPSSCRGRLHGLRGVIG